MERKGKIIAVRGPIVDVRFPANETAPGLYEIIEANNYYGQRVVLEVVEYLNKRSGDIDNVTRCIALTSTYGLQRNSEARALGSVIKVPVGSEVCGRMLNVLGEPIDNKGEIKAKKTLPVRRRGLNPVSLKSLTEEGKVKFEIMETGIKVIDLLFPLVKGTKTGILGGAALGKSILTLEIIHNVIKKHRGFCVFTGAGERIREANELYNKFVAQGILDKLILVFGQMDESPGARFEVAFTGVTLAEHFQEQGEDVLFFIDNVFRFAQAGAELSALLGRIPSETGYQPTLMSEMSDFQERIRAGKKASITAVEAVYVPSDDLTDPAVVCIFSYLDSIIVLSREYVQQGLYPAINPLASSCSYLEPGIVGEKHFDIAQKVMNTFNKHEELSHVVSIIGIDELSKQERLIFERAQKLQNFMTQPFFTAELYTEKKGVYISIEETLRGCERILSGEVDKKSKDDLYMIGSLPQ